MSKELLNTLYQSDLNKVIQQKLLSHSGMGSLENEKELPSYIISNMNDVANEIARVVIELNKIFIEKNITANSSDTYIRFLCDLLSDYLLVPNPSDIGTLSREELETIVLAQMENTSIEMMRASLAQHAYNNQSIEAVLTKEQITQQYSQIEDFNIKEAYKTLLTKQFQAANQSTGE